MNEKCNTTIDYGFDDGLRLERVSHIVPAAEGTENTLFNDGKIIQISPERMKELEVNPWLDINKEWSAILMRKSFRLCIMATAVTFIIRTLGVKRTLWFMQIQMLPIW